MDKLVKKIRAFKGVQTAPHMLNKYDKANDETNNMFLALGIPVTNVVYINRVKHIIIDGVNVKAKYKNHG